MKTIVWPVSTWRRQTSSCMSRRINGSRALNGSSYSITAGSVANARATPTRCCMPPESWSGNWFSTSSSPTSESSSRARRVPLLLRHAADLEPERDVVDHPAISEEPEVLEDHRDRVAAELAQLGVVLAAMTSRSAIRIGARGRLDQCGSGFGRGSTCPSPERPITTKTSPRGPRTRRRGPPPRSRSARGAPTGSAPRPTCRGCGPPSARRSSRSPRPR